MQFDFLKPLFPAKPIAPAASVKPARIPPPERPQVIRIVVPPASGLEQKARELLLSVGAVALAKRLCVRWNPRLRNTAGMAFPGKALITLNPRLVHFGEVEIDRTLRHELAHLLAHDRAGRRRIEPHGPEWKRACCDLGLPDEKRTHDLPLPRHTQKPRHFYHCPNCGTELTRVRPLRRNSACLRCCRAHSGGRYDPRFRFIPRAPADH